MSLLSSIIAAAREPGLPARLLKMRPVRFIAIGIVNTIFGYSVFALLYVVSGDHRMSIVGATIVGVIFNFFTTARIVFKNSNNRLIFRFISGYAISLGANMMLLEVLVRAGVGPLVAQLICLPPVVVLTYFVNARLVFRNKPAQSTIAD